MHAGGYGAGPCGNGRAALDALTNPQAFGWQVDLLRRSPPEKPSNEARAFGHAASLDGSCGHRYCKYIGGLNLVLVLVGLGDKLVTR